MAGSATSSRTMDDNGSSCPIKLYEKGQNVPFEGNMIAEMIVLDLSSTHV
jgi:hypothetical protein